MSSFASNGIFVAHSLCWCAMEAYLGNTQKVWNSAVRCQKAADLEFLFLRYKSFGLDFLFYMWKIHGGIYRHKVGRPILIGFMYEYIRHRQINMQSAYLHFKHPNIFCTSDELSQSKTQRRMFGLNPQVVFKMQIRWLHFYSLMPYIYMYMYVFMYFSNIIELQLNLEKNIWRPDHKRHCIVKTPPKVQGTF